ncbi:hypothetical protein EMIT0P43_30123 [Pseudomonas jessenii]
MRFLSHRATLQCFLFTAIPLRAKRAPSLCICKSLNCTSGNGQR